MATLPVGVRLDEELVKRIDSIVERTGVSRTEIIERCVAMGLEDEEMFVEWLESPVKGPFMSLLTHPMVLQLLGVHKSEIDRTNQKIRKNLRGKKRSPKGRHVTE